MNIAVQAPQWGTNYLIGYTGFVIRKDDALAAGIRWFESQWGELTGQKLPSHTLVITGADQTIEALSDGVKTGNLTAYLSHPDCALLVRRPRGYNLDLGDRIAAAAQDMVGDKYGFRLIGALAVANSLTGQLLDRMSRGKFSHWITGLADAARHEICSQVVAKAMRSQPELAPYGCLMEPPETVKPSDLFYDTWAYEPPAYAVELV